MQLMVSRMCSTNTYLFFVTNQHLILSKAFYTQPRCIGFQGPIIHTLNPFLKKRVLKIKKKNSITLVVFYIAGDNLLQAVLTHLPRLNVIQVCL